MGYQVLLKREKVYDILQRTLEDYYRRNNPDKSVAVSYAPLSDSIKYRLVPVLGMIMPTSPDKKIKNHYYDCFHLRGNLIRRCGAKILVFLNLNFRTHLSEKFCLYVSPSTIASKSVIYKYLNRSIRIFDFSSGRTISIQKKGFTSKFFQNQLRYRLSAPYDFIPPIYNYADDWFEEDILQGLVLARVTDKKRFAKGIEDAIEGMRQIANETFREEKVGDYITSLFAKFSTLLSGILKKKTITNNIEWLNHYVERLVKSISSKQETLNIVKSHGDLQAGNIWMAPHKTYIIDWETVDERSAWFDVITIMYGTRYYGGIKALYEKIKSKERVCEFSSVFPSNISDKEAFAIFLLEDLIFYLEDMIELTGDGGVDTLNRYISELQEINWQELFEK